MGLAISEILGSEYFKGFKILAGHNGIHKQIQGIAILDAPDGYLWTKGRELVMTSGYLFKDDPDLFKKYTQDKGFREMSGMAIKVDRYLKEIDKEILEKFDEYEIPLIYVPSGPSWMDIMNHLNVLVINKNIKQFRIEGINTKALSDISYQSRKINQILGKIEKEMNFPAMLYEVSNDVAYYSSPIFEKISDELNYSDFWSPPFKHTREILCDNLNITRFRFLDEKYQAPFSWILIPIIINNQIKAYFVILEAEGLIDYFDQFALRIGFLLIQSLYEQILISDNQKLRGFQKFISDIINRNLINKDTIRNEAKELDLELETEYLVGIVKDKEGKEFKEKESIEKIFYNCFRKLKGRLALINDKSYLILLPIDEDMSMKENQKQIRKSINKFNNYLKSEIKELNISVGISDIPGPIEDIYISYTRANKALEMGYILYGNLYYITYSELGPLAWMDIKVDEIDIMKKSIENLLIEDNKELIKTLSTYLESNMNYSVTAKKLYIHINTVRNRIKHIEDLVDLDLEDPITKLKLIILFKIIGE